MSSLAIRVYIPLLRLDYLLQIWPIVCYTSRYENTSCCAAGSWIGFFV